MPRWHDDAALGSTVEQWLVSFSGAYGLFPDTRLPFFPRKIWRGGGGRLCAGPNAIRISPKPSKRRLRRLFAPGWHELARHSRAPRRDGAPRRWCSRCAPRRQRRPRCSRRCQSRQDVPIAARPLAGVRSNGRRKPALASGAATDSLWPLCASFRSKWPMASMCAVRGDGLKRWYN